MPFFVVKSLKQTLLHLLEMQKKIENVSTPFTLYSIVFPFLLCTHRSTKPKASFQLPYELVCVSYIRTLLLLYSTFFTSLLPGCIVLTPEELQCHACCWLSVFITPDHCFPFIYSTLLHSVEPKRTCWCRPMISATWDSVARKVQIQSHHEQLSETLSWKKKKSKEA